MNDESYRKIVVAGCMAVALAIGIALFALRHPAVPAVAQQPAPPPPTTEQAPPAPPQVAQSGEGSSQPAATESVASNTAVAPPMVAKARSTPTQPRNRPVTPSLAAADVGVNQGGAVAASLGSTSGAVVPPDSSESNNSKDNDANDAAATGDSPQDAAKPNGSSDYAAADRQITIDVKSEISRDGSNKGAVIEVSTDHGVVALSGTVPDQNTFDHVKEVVARVQGVMGVDTSALSVASLMSSAIQH
jgi:hypothetical protein